MAITEPHGVALVGAGKRGLYLAEQLTQNGRGNFVAVCDPAPDIQRRLSPAPDGRQPTVYRDIDAMLADPRVGVVIVASPDPCHADQALRVLRAGKHLLLEKPMTQSVADGLALLEAWRQHPVVFMVALELRYCSLAQTMKQLLREGRIGPVRLALAVDNVSVGGRYFFHNRYRQRQHVINLVLQKGVHTLDLMNWFIDARPTRVYAETGLDVFGGDQPSDKRCRDCPDRGDCPEFVQADVATGDSGRKEADDFCVWGREVDVSDNTVIAVRYDNGCKLSYLQCHFAPDYNRQFILYGSKGRMTGWFSNSAGFRIELAYRHDQPPEVLQPPMAEGDHGGADPAMINAFLDLLDAGEPCCPGVVTALDTTAIALAVDQACAGGASVQLHMPPWRGTQS